MKKLFDYCFLALGLMIQVVTFLLMPHDSWLSLVSGCLGICSVCLASQGNILTFAFGFGQVITYAYLCWTQRFYAEMAINAYYFGTMIYGVFLWKKHLAKEGEKLVVPRSLKPYTIALIAAAVALGSWIVGLCLATWTDDTQPYLDAYTTIPALVAQVLLILVYRENWFIWLAVDILCVILWIRAKDYFMVTQYVIWCANCVYGIISWKKA